MISIAWLLLSVLVGYLGRDRRFGFLGCFLASVLLSPLAVALILLATHPTPTREPIR